MSPLPRIDRRVVTSLALSLLVWTAAETPAWAQRRQPKAEAAPEPSYVLPYAVVILGIALGMMATCRTSRRADKAKSEGEFAGLTAEELRAAQSSPGTRGAVPMGIHRTQEIAPQARQALTTGIVSIVLPIAGLLVGPLAIWQAIQARKLIKDSPHLKGDELAVGGLGTGIAGVVVGFIWLIILVVLMSRSPSTPEEDTDARRHEATSVRLLCRTDAAPASLAYLIR